MSVPVTLLTLVFSAAGLAEAGPGFKLDVGSDGRIRHVELAGQSVIGHIRLQIVQPGWRGAVASTTDAHVTGRREGPAGQEILESVAPSSKEPLVEFRREIEFGPQTVRFRYLIMPRQDLVTETTLVQLSLPLGGYRGRPWRLFDDLDSQEGVFPLELPANYAFLQGQGFASLACQIPGHEDYLALEPKWQGIRHVQIQDNRRFSGGQYEVQLYADAPKTLRRGQQYDLAFSLRRVAGTDIETNWQRTRQARQALADSMTGHGPAAILDIRPHQDAAAVYEKFELAVRLQAEFSNPFDPDDVALDAHFVTPSGTTHLVPGFFWQGFRRERVDGSERLRPTGEHDWRVRYCPIEAGRYRYRLVLRDGAAEVRSREMTFEVTPRKHSGFVRLARANPYVFEHDDGSAYFAIGENVCWSGKGGTYEYDNYWAKLADHGANYARLWIGPFDLFTLERVARGQADPAGLGRYDLGNSWRIDHVIDLAEQRGLKIMFCIDSFNSLRIHEPHAIWDRCPYNAACGGPIQQPEQFFTDEAARGLFKRRLRYIVARWSYSPAILSWEFWNEVNIIEKYVSAEVAAWHREMARHLRQLDPFDHLITTSWAGHEGDPAVDGLPEMDYIQSHQYGAHDAATMMIDVCHKKRQRFRKPHYFGEFGTGTRAEGTRQDKDGIHLHNGLWSGVVGGAAGTAMLWWWDNYVEPLDLYRHFRPVARFVEDIPFNLAAYRPAGITAITYADPPPAPRLEDLTIHASHASWKPALQNQPTTFTVHPDGRVEPADRVTRVLHGVRNHPDLHNPATFLVDYQKPGTFVVEVTGVSGHGGAKLKVHLDDQLQIDRDFVDDDKSPETLSKYNGSYSLDVPAGKHQVRVVNDGRDWLLASYRLTGYRQRNDPGLQAWALIAEPAVAHAPVAILWVKNERYNWYNHNQDEPLRTIPATVLYLEDLADGSYELQWWDTYAGKVTSTTKVTAKDGRLRVPVPSLSKDLAAKVLGR